MHYMPEEVNEGYSRRADIFEYPQMNTGTMYEEYVPIYPNSNITDTGSIYFKISGASAGYIDGKDISMTVTMKLVKEDDTPVTTTDDVTVTNQSLYSMFKMVTCSLNSTYVNSEVGANYAYKAYIDTMINNNNVSYSSEDILKGYYADDEDTVAITTAIPTDSEAIINAGVLQRHELTHKGGEVVFKGKVGVDFLEVNKYIVSGVDINLEFYQQSDEFRLIAKNNTHKYKLKITSMFLTVKYVRLRPEILMAHTKRFAETTHNEAHYPYNKSSVRVFTIPKGVMGFEQSAINGDKIPNKIIVSFVKNESYAGTYDSNPLQFEHLSTIFACFEIDGRAVPHAPFTTNFSTNKYESCYDAMLNGMKRPELSTITPKDYKNGRTFFVFNVTNSDMDDVYPVLKRGSTRLCFRFAKALPYSISAIVYMLGVGEYVVSKSRIVRIEY